MEVDVLEISGLCMTVVLVFGSEVFAFFHETTIFEHPRH